MAGKLSSSVASRAVLEARAGGIAPLARMTERRRCSRSVSAGALFLAGARALYEAADQRLAKYHDAGIAPLREQLARDLAVLKDVPTPDVPAIAARLARAEESVASMLSVLGQFIGG